MTGRRLVVWWLLETFTIDARINNNHALRLSCAQNDLGMAQWLHKTYSLTIDDVRQAKAFSKSCEYGQLEVAQWLHHTFVITVCDGCEPFRLACTNGHLHVAQWIHTTFGLTRGDAQPNDTWAMSLSTKHLPVARWLHETVGITLGHHDCTLAYVCSSGHLQCARWLHATFNTTHDQAKCALLVSSTGPVCQWLTTTYKIDSSQVTKPMWRRTLHDKWYWQAEVLIAASCLPAYVLVDMLCCM